jgi:hypothetical protein
VKLKVLPFLFLLIILFSAMTSFPSVSYACKCAGPPSIEKELERSNAVFSGKVIDIDNNRNNQKILFEVEEAWKGVSKTQIILTDEQSSCSLNFSEGKSYLVYAYDFQGDLTTNICDRTKELSSAKDDLEYLGEGTSPTEEVNLNHPFGIPAYIWLSLAILSIVSFYIIRKRFKI